jgi:GNAT superfamily N-acetyltransferase
MPNHGALTLHPASTFPLDALAAALNTAYAGYLVPVQFTPAALEQQVATMDITLDRSLVARGPDDELLGIALLGVRGERGWVGGVGIAQQWRGQGWGAVLMQSLIEQARLLGLRTMQLEVLEQNHVAHQLYLRLGFTDVRLLYIFAGPLARDRLPSLNLPNSPGVVAQTTAMPIAEELATYAELLQVTLPWQREVASLAHRAQRATAPERPSGLEAVAFITAPSSRGSVDAKPEAVLFAEADVGTHASRILTLVGLGSRGATATEQCTHGLTLLAALVADRPDVASLRAVNLAEGDPLAGVLTVLGCPVVMAQHEMMLVLR